MAVQKKDIIARKVAEGIAVITTMTDEAFRQVLTKTKGPDAFQRLAQEQPAAQNGLAQDMMAIFVCVGEGKVFEGAVEHDPSRNMLSFATKPDPSQNRLTTKVMIVPKTDRNLICNLRAVSSEETASLLTQRGGAGPQRKRVASFAPSL